MRIGASDTSITAKFKTRCGLSIVRHSSTPLKPLELAVQVDVTFWIRLQTTLTTTVQATSMEPVPANPDLEVTKWMRQLEEGKSESAQQLWNHFCQKLMALANKRLSPKLRQSYDEEDVAVSAFHSLCRVISDRGSATLRDRAGLWQLLMTITERKISNRLRDESRDKRDHRRTVSEACFQRTPVPGKGFDSLPGREPSPEFAAEFADLCGSLLDSLEDEQLREIAQLTLKNYDTAEIAQRLGTSRRTIERKLLVIQNRWQKQL